MSARVLDGTVIGKTIRDEVAVEVTRLKATGRRPGLAAVLVGEDPASAVYVRSKGKACEEAGMHSVTIRLPPDTPEADLLETVDRLAADCGALLATEDAFEPGTMRESHFRASSGRAEIVSGAWALLHAVEHLREHMGHAQLTRQLWDEREG